MPLADCYDRLQRCGISLKPLNALDELVYDILPTCDIGYFV